MRRQTADRESLGGSYCSWTLLIPVRDWIQKASCLLEVIESFKIHAPPPELVWLSLLGQAFRPRDSSWPSQRPWLQDGLEGVVGVQGLSESQVWSWVPKGPET